MKLANALRIGCVCAALVGAAACAEDVEGPLDPDLLADLARATGDKTGDEWSGEYHGSAPTIECDCPTVDLIPTEGGASFSADLCLFANDGNDQLSSEIVHTDGFVATRGELELSGAIESDDAVVLAGLQDFSNAFGSIQLYGRLDGEFSSDADGSHLRGELRQRIVAELVTEDVDCQVRYDLAITRDP